MKFEDALLYKKQVKTLYVNAFPQEERAPISYLYYQVKKGKGHFYAVVDDDQFIGLTFVVQTQDIVSVIFLAIEKDHQRKGYGSRILKELKHKYQSFKIFLTIEVLDPSANNYQQRKKRKAFYQRNGFVSEDYKVQEAGVTYEVLSFGGTVTKQDYQFVMKQFYGRILYKFIVKV